MTRPVSCLGDLDSWSFRPCCVYPTNVVTPIVSTVFATGRCRAHVGDVLTPAPGFPVCPKTVCPPLPRTIIGVSKVIVDKRPSAHIGDLTNPVSPRIILSSPVKIFTN